MQVELTHLEMTLAIEALKRAATRQESEGRFDPRNAGPHDKKAAAMRRLALRIENQLAAAFVKATE